MEDNTVPEQDNTIMHEFSGPKPKGFLTKKVVLLFIFLLLFGIATGNILYNTQSITGVGDVLENNGLSSNTQYEKGQSFGSTDKQAFPDTTEGVLKEGGIDGEGAYHLERPGGVSQNVYLTSTVIDLSDFLGAKVKIWGKTYEGEKAGWLMDVGRLQIL